MFVPRLGESPVVNLAITPRVINGASLSISIYARNELYRHFVVNLRVAKPETAAPPTPQPAARIKDEVTFRPERHLGKRPDLPWANPPGRLNIELTPMGVTVVGEDRADPDEISMVAFSEPGLPAGDALTANMHSVRDALNDLRDEFGSSTGYFNNIDPGDLLDRLRTYQPPEDWERLSGSADKTHQQAWEEVRSSNALRDLAYWGYALYDTVFPRSTRRRSRIDQLPAGFRIELTWQSPPSQTIPWGLMYCQPLTDEAAVDPMYFFGLRFRLGFMIAPRQDGRLDLGGPAETHQTHLLYWGDDDDEIARESAWQRTSLRGFKAPPAERIGLHPATPVGATAIQAIRQQLKTPSPDPVWVIYFYCQTKENSVSQPVLHFAKSDDPIASSIRLPELGHGRFGNGPLVFANACTTVAGNPTFASALTDSFLRRECSAIIGTETLVPIQLGSRLAHVFFEFFYRNLSDDPIPAGEALAQTKLFLWTEYNNIGGLFYTLINQYDLYLATSEEISAMSIEQGA